MIHSNLFEHPEKILNKLTRNGSPNPRFVTAVREAREAKQRLKDLVGDYTHLSRAQIKREYTPEKVEALLAAGNENLKRMASPLIRPGWMGEE